MTVKYPDVHVRLSDADGNGFVIVSRVSAALRRAGVRETKIQAFQHEATLGDYDHLLSTVFEWVDVG